MSYILDALRKSDELRQQGAVPTLMSAELPVVEDRPPAISWLLGAAAVLFLAGILIGWLQPWSPGQAAGEVAQSSDKARVEAPAARPPVASSMPPAAVAPQKAGPGPVTKAAPALPAVGAAVPAPVQVSQSPAMQIAPPVSADKSAAATPRGPGPVLREPAAPAPVRPAPATDPNVISKNELPPAILQELPGMSVSLHAYSAKAANRLVSVNDKFLQEGESLVPGLVLEQITPRDMIFSYKGYRFRQGVQ